MEGSLAFETALSTINLMLWRMSSRDEFDCTNLLKPEEFDRILERVSL